MVVGWAPRWTGQTERTSLLTLGEEYLEAVQACREVGIQVYADVVFNHKMNADDQERYLATPYDPYDRNRPLGEERTISAWTRFRFDGRGGRY